MEQDVSGTAVSRYSRVAMLIHWLTAAAILFELGLGLTMTGPRGAGTFAGYQLHKSIGITILLLTALRIVWRLSHRTPDLPHSLAKVERLAARVTHAGFYAILLVLPLSGWLIVSSSKVPVPTRLFGMVPWPGFPGTSALEATARVRLHDLAETSHELLAYGAILLLVLHVLGALKHHLAARDGYMGRMLPVTSGRLGLATGAILLAAVVCIAAGAGFVSLAGRSSARATDAAPLTQASAPVDAATEQAPLPADTAAPNADASATPDLAAATQEPEAAASADWKVDPSKSSLGFLASWNGQTLSGRFSRWTAKIHFDPEALETASVDVKIVMASAGTGSSEVDEALPGTDWFAANTHPSAQFIARRFRMVGKGQFEASGTLIIRGMSHPLKLPFRLTIDGDTARMSGSAVIDRRTFGVGQGEWAATDSVGANVTIKAAIVATRDHQ